MRCCCSVAASMRLDHRRSGVAHTRPHPAGCPGTVLAVVVSIYVRPGLGGRRRSLSRACANTLWAFLGLRGGRRIHAARSWLISGWVRDLRSCCGVAASCGSTIVGPAWLIRARILRAALWPFSRWLFPSMCGPSGPQGIVQIRRHPCRLGSRCEPPLGQRHPCRRPSAPDGNGLLWFRARDHRWCRRCMQGAGRATVGRSSSGGMDAAGALVFARDASLQDAGGRARSRGPEGRHRQAEPTPEHPQASPHDAGGFWCAGTTRVEPQGCGDAATRPHAAHPTSDQPRPSRRMRRRPRHPSNSPRVFAHPFDKSKPPPRNRRQVKLRRHGCRRSVGVCARREPAGCRRKSTIPRPGGPP